MTNAALRIGIVAGEASGDLLGAKLIEKLKQYHPALHIEGVGGSAMQAAGCANLFDMERLAVMGFIEPLKRLPDLIKLRRDLYQHFMANRPDIFIGIDAPDFNLGLELKLRQAGIKTLHYVSPSVWAWRQGRIHKIARAVDMMLTLLPFEAAFYEEHHVPVRYVGHPLAEHIPLTPDTTAARRALGLVENTTYVALMPGSRRQEIHYMAEPFLLAAKLMWQQKPDLKFITSQINVKRYQEFYAAYQQIAPELPLQFFMQRSSEVLAAADVVAVTSGTATLETMLYKKPMVIAYRMSRLTYMLARWLVKTPYAGLPNLLAGRLLVPEFIQDAVTPQAIAQPLLHYINHPNQADDLKAEFTALHRMLQENRTDPAAIIMNLIDKKSSES
jgi:lipid-A-disaccharide synthase